jgi:hypothetical protein
MKIADCLQIGPLRHNDRRIVFRMTAIAPGGLRPLGVLDMDGKNVGVLPSYEQICGVACHDGLVPIPEVMAEDF